MSTRKRGAGKRGTSTGKKQAGGGRHADSDEDAKGLARAAEAGVIGGKRKLGRLLLIGGHEERSAEGEILRRFVELAGGRSARIVAVGAALDAPEQTLAEYRRVFTDLGATDVRTFAFSRRNDGEEPELLDAIQRATALFLTGGDQLQLTSTMAGTAFGETVRMRLQQAGLIVAGTSAGAAAAGSVMPIGGPKDGTVRRADVELAPGLGYWRDAVVDTHFAQRGRVNRLLTLFATNPQVLGVGLDENTAIELELGRRFRVLGQGAVLVFDGRVTFSNAADVGPEEVLALFDSKVHVLARGYGFDLQRMQPLTPPALDGDGAGSDRSR